MCSELCIAGYLHKVRLRRSRKCRGRRKSRWVVTGDANASHDHKRGQARDMGERELGLVHRRMEGKGNSSCLAWSSPPTKGRA